MDFNAVSEIMKLHLYKDDDFQQNKISRTWLGKNEKKSYSISLKASDAVLKGILPGCPIFATANVFAWRASPVLGMATMFGGGRVSFIRQEESGPGQQTWGDAVPVRERREASFLAVHFNEGTGELEIALHAGHHRSESMPTWRNRGDEKHERKPFEVVMDCIEKYMGYEYRMKMALRAAIQPSFAPAVAHFTHSWPDDGNQWF